MRAARGRRLRRGRSQRRLAPRGRSARACARRPSDSPTARRRCARRDGRGSPPPADCARTARATARTDFGRADALRDLGVARGRARRDRAQRLPHALLERGAAHVERQIEAQRRRFDEADDLRDELLERRRRRRSGRARGKRSCRSRASASGSSPMRIAQTPRSLAATRIEPERAFADGEADRRCPRRRRDSSSASCPAPGSTPRRSARWSRSRRRRSPRSPCRCGRARRARDRRGAPPRRPSASRR